MIKTHDNDNAEMTMHVPSSGETDFKQKEYTILTIRAMSRLLGRSFCEKPSPCTSDSDKGFGLIFLGECSCSIASKVGCVHMSGCSKQSIGVQGKKIKNLQKWASENFMQSKKFRCKMLHLGLGSLRHDHRLGDEFTDSSSAEKASGFSWMKTWI